MKENDEKLREILTSEEVPEQISPENIKKMLDEKAPKKKRSGISVAGRIAAGVAACAVVAGSYAGTAQLMKARKSGGNGSSVSEPDGRGVIKEEGKHVEAPYMNGAASYEEVYELLERSTKKYEKQQKKYQREGGYYKTDGAVMEESIEYAAPVDEEAFNDVNKDEASPELGLNEIGDTEVSPEHSETYDQEEGVREADIVKTDGRNIYYVWNKTAYSHYDEEKAVYTNYYSTTPTLDIASVKDGEFTGTKKLDLTPDLSSLSVDPDSNYTVTVYDMYIYNDMIEVIGNVSAGGTYYGGYYNKRGYYIDDEGDFYQPVSSTFVSVYTTGGDPELIGTYYQDGWYNDVRIAPDGCMYLISSYSTVDLNSVEDAKNVERYIPCCGTEGEVECLPPEDVLMPVEPPEAKTLLDYTVISGIDLSKAGELNVVDQKALAGFTGTIYSSADNIYAAVYQNYDTDITRIAVSGGTITPMASGTVEGYVLNQFSMSEYNGYFRIATTLNKFHDNSSFFGDIFGTSDPSYTERTNAVTVLDMNMNTVGSLKGFGDDESVKSVNFSGDMGYVVTYRQTDPLFAIDFSDPTAPTILDEFKINGFSTYMQKWSDGLLLGFGIDANSDGIQTGVKLVMFDNSDPNDLKEVGFMSLSSDNMDIAYVYSTATYERKSLLIAPEKNLIGFPVQIYDSNYESSYKYMFYSYENGEFVFRGDVGDIMNNGNVIAPDRAVYIGGYVYVLSGEVFTSADMETFTVKDRAVFSD